MYLKTIEIVGFKSFAERTRVEMRPGITGVVGPNGCGKSNIMEAVRWCIGEMSWKALRSDSMAGIIFAGTARRNAMNLAEVTLTFDNAERLLPVQYSEVSVSRRIYRSGESEYYLNKTQCRLRDIRELFLDTGIGNAGYAIIDQGGVDFVLQSKPEERRALFEEAAGVSKYKAKRQEALRKLDRVEIDLGRLQDSVSLINEQIKKLDADARKANLFQKYKEELSGLEAAQILKELVEIGAQLESESAQLVPLADALAGLKTAIDAGAGRLAAMNLERTRQEGVVLESNQRLFERKSEIGRLEERIENAGQARREIDGRIVLGRAEAKRETERALALDPEIARAGAAYDQASADCESARRERDELRAEFEQLSRRREEAGAAAARLRGELLRLTGEVQEASRGISDAQSRLGQLDYAAGMTGKELGKKRAELEARRAQRERFEASRTAQAARLEESRRLAGELETARSERAAELAALAEEAMGRHAERAKVEARIEALEAQGRRDPYWAGAQAVVDAALPGVLGTVRSLLSFDDSRRRAVEDALGERLHAVVASDLASARGAIEFLKESGKGRARFLVASSLPERAPEPMGFPPESRPLLEGIRFDAAHASIAAHLLGEAYAMPEGLYGRHWVCGGAPEGPSGGLSLSELEPLRGRLVELSQAQELCAQRKLRLEEALAELESRRAGAESSLRQEASALLALEAEGRQARESFGALEEELVLIEAEAARIAGEQESGRARVGELAALCEERRGAEQIAGAAAAEASERLAALGESVAQKRPELEHFDKTLSGLETQRSFLQSARDRLGADKAALLESAASRERQEKEGRARLSELARLDRESRVRLDELHRELAEIEKEASGLFSALQATQREAAETEQALGEKRAEAEELQARIHACELSLSQIRGRREFLAGRLRSEWELEFEEAREKYAGRACDDERVEFLRRRIASLGNVNMAAPEEYEELTKRRDHLQSQIDDLNSARQDLHAVIAKINATTRENFRQTFAEVREHFRKMYAILFDGGEADLVLTDEAAAGDGSGPAGEGGLGLEAGVDIVAQPPGKRLRSISQLSGGEKTLTAIALLFSFFMVKPSPVCMLDEADAALDEANVERFVSLLREFGGKTQFLIVSHNKATMEACDAIYGVTMEESGVSQLISVEFRKRAPAGAPAGAAPAADSFPEGGRHGGSAGQGAEAGESGAASGNGGAEPAAEPAAQ